MIKHLLVIFFLISFSARAQTSVYHPFADSGAVWRMQWTNACLFPPCVLNCNADYQYRVDGDTILSGNTYRKVIKEGYSVNNCNCIMNVASCSGSTYGSAFYMGIRDDSINRKAYIHDGVQPEELFFDFNLIAGDSVQNRFCNRLITAVDSVLAGSNYRKSYTLYGGGKVIEGIGYVDNSNYDGPFEGCGPCVCNDIWRFLCYRLNGVVLYGDTLCQLVTSVSEVEQDNFPVFLSPNPATTEIRIESTTFGIESIEIFDVLGKRVYSEQPQTSDLKPQTVNVTTLHSGMYFVKVRGENKQAVIKLIRE